MTKGIDPLYQRRMTKDERAAKDQAGADDAAIKAAERKQKADEANAKAKARNNAPAKEE